MIDYEKLRAAILVILADEDYYGGPPFRVPPTACRAAIADAILGRVVDIEDEEEEQQS